MSTFEAYRSLYPSDFIERFLKEQIRPDGRGLMGTRPINISTGRIIYCIMMASKSIEFTTKKVQLVLHTEVQW